MNRKGRPVGTRVPFQRCYWPTEKAVREFVGKNKARLLALISFLTPERADGERISPTTETGETKQ